MLADTRSHVIAAVPRVRARVDSGVSVAGRTMHDPELEHFGAAVASLTGLTYIANVQARRDVAGPRVPAGGEPAGPRGAAADHGQRGGHAPAGPGRAARPARCPDHVDFHEVAMVRFLDERFMDLSEVQKVAA